MFVSPHRSINDLDLELFGNVIWHRNIQIMRHKHGHEFHNYCANYDTKHGKQISSAFGRFHSLHQHELQYELCIVVLFSGSEFEIEEHD